MKKFAAVVATAFLFIPAQVHAAPINRCPKYEALIREYHLPVKKFSYIAYRESRCNPKSISAVRKATGRPDVGLLQIQGSWATVTKNICKVPYSKVIKALTNVRCNLAVGAYLFQHGGFGHWKGSSRS